MKKRTLKGIVSIGLCAAMLLAFYVAAAVSGQVAPANALPPRYTPSPTLNPALHEVQGGYIELQALSFTSAPILSVVQWQDGIGDWHDISGWQDTPQRVGEYYRTRWWVYPRDYGKGPFRWAIYRAGGNQPAGPLAVSLPFTLPVTVNDVVAAQVIVPAE